MYIQKWIKPIIKQSLTNQRNEAVIQSITNKLAKTHVLVLSNTDDTALRVSHKLEELPQKRTLSTCGLALEHNPNFWGSQSWPWNRTCNFSFSGDGCSFLRKEGEGREGSFWLRRLYMKFSSFFSFLFLLFLLFLFPIHFKALLAFFSTPLHTIIYI